LSPYIDAFNPYFRPKNFDFTNILHIQRFLGRNQPKNPLSVFFFTGLGFEYFKNCLKIFAVSR
jgi:hypothetical protein